MHRLLDIIFSFVAMVVLVPFLSPVIMILRFSGEREIFYKQQRVGVNGKEFRLFKFATMLKNSPNIVLAR